MARTMHDALYTSNIGTADILAYYPYDNPDGVVPKAAQVLTIDNGGMHADCNIMDATDAPYSPSDTPTWIRQNTTAYPTIYADLGDVPAVMTALADVGRTWYLWVADWTGQPHVPEVAGANVVGCQYASGPNYDTSTITDDSWYPLEETMAITVQNDWAFCSKCKGLFYGPDQDTSVCPAGDTHTNTNSYDYALPYS